MNDRFWPVLPVLTGRSRPKGANQVYPARVKLWCWQSDILSACGRGTGSVAMTLTPRCKTWSLRRRNRSPHECIDNQARWQGQLRSCGRGFDSRCPSFCNQVVGNFGRLGIMANNAGVFTGLKTIRKGNETGIEPFDPSPVKTVILLDTPMKKALIWALSKS